MKIIAHRGNLYGPNPETENTIGAISRAIAEGFEVEVDVWIYNNRVFCGHDMPQHEIPYVFYCWLHTHCWIHWKGLNSYTGHRLIMQYTNENNWRGFTHDKEPYVKVSGGSIWLYPGTPITGEMRSAPAIVACLPELAPDWDLTHATHICTDYPIKYDIFLNGRPSEK